MSTWGFDDVIREYKRAEKRFLREGIILAQKEEFAKNFVTESNSETGVPWMDTTRPNPILKDQLRLRQETLSQGNITIAGNKGILFIDPVDDRGRGYAAYHQESPSQGNNIQREFITASNEILDKQEALLISILDQTFK